MPSRIIKLVLLVSFIGLFAAAGSVAADQRYTTGYERYKSDERYRTNGWRSPFFTGTDRGVFGLKRFKDNESRRFFGLRDRSMRNILDTSGPAGRETTFKLRNSMLRRSVMGSPRQMYGVRPVKR